MKVLGVELYDKGFDQLLNEVKERLEDKADNLLMSPSDANTLVYAYKNVAFSAILKTYAYNIPDGVPSVWVGKFKGAKEMTRCSGPDFFLKILEQTKDRPIRHYLLGGQPEVLQQLKQVIQEDIKNPNVVGDYSPPFRALDEKDIKAIATRINEANPHFVWVGLGAPKQQIIAKQLAQYTQVHFYVTVGAAFDFLAGNVKKAPVWIQKMGLEWLFRAFSEPKRLGKRYIKVVPQFIWFNLMELLLGKKKA